MATRKKKNNIGAFGHPIYGKGFAKYGEMRPNGSSETPNDIEEAAQEYEKKHTYQRYDGGGLTPEYDATLAEAIICGAFEKHFGFPLSEVKDKENPDRLVELGNPIQTYRYRGEVFLYLAEGTPQIDGDEITWSSRVLEV